ncbi:hypothetical protein JCM24511_06176 [Saitozyma sp. JCM 24511]|nr:hypothetical protein JCM24511_06176 [Saitozyma sp. JCM 24511]
MSTTLTELASSSIGGLSLRAEPIAANNLSDLEMQGHYVDELNAWLESFGMGFKSDDRSTWHVGNVPQFEKGGLFFRHGVAHEQFVWDLRSEPAVIDVFAKIWGTDELIVSYDTVNVSLPYPKEEMDESRTKPWPHVDQSPLRTVKHCIQGIVNLHENGPLDGGLVVLDGSLPLFAEYFACHDAPDGGWPQADWFRHSEETLQWFYDRGCKWVKVEAQPGDLILWDSRTIHYGDAARGDRPRMAAYVCYKPAKDISSEMLALKRDCFAEWVIGPKDRILPRTEPALSDRAKQLAGLVSYQ